MEKWLFDKSMEKELYHCATECLRKWGDHLLKQPQGIVRGWYSRINKHFEGEGLESENLNWLRERIKSREDNERESYKFKQVKPARLNVSWRGMKRA